MLPRVLAVLPLTLAGCYVGARGGPTYSFDGDRRGTTIEIFIGAEIHFSPESASPVDRRYALFNSIGVARTPADGSHHAGVAYEFGGSALVQVDELPSSFEFLRVDLSVQGGQLAGVDGADAGDRVGALGLVEFERYWNEGWALRIGGGAGIWSVTTEGATPGTLTSESSYSPIGALTVEFTPLVRRALAQVISR